MTNNSKRLEFERRVDLAREVPFALGSMQVRPATREVIGAAGREILEPRVMQVLVALARANSEIVTRDDLTASCWEGRVVGEDAINRAISKIRRLAETQYGFTLETVTKVGYRLLPARPSIAATEPAPSATHTRHLLGTFVVAALLLVGGLWLWRSQPPAQAASVAVLPFDPLYTDPDAQFFADGVASSVATALAEVGVPVVSQTQSFQYRGAAQADAARALGAAFLVHGDVNREGGDMRISVRVEDARHGVTVLTKVFEAPAAEARVVREQIAAEIAGALSWGGGSASGFVWRGTPSADVTIRLCRIRQQVAENDRTGAYETARALARSAPESARAQAMLAHLTGYSLRAIPTEDRPAALAAGRAAARRALRLDPSLGDVYPALSGLTPTFLWAQREALIRRAIEIDPDSSIAPSVLGALLRASGRVREAEPQTARATALDPLWANAVGEQLDVLMALGRYEEARQVLERATRIWPNDRGMIENRFDIAIALGGLEEADAMLRDPAATAVLLAPDRPPTHRTLVRALRTRRAPDSGAFAAACSDASRITRNGAYNCLIGLSLLGELDAAFGLAAQMYPDLRAPNPAALEQRWLATAGVLQSTGVLFIPQTAALRGDTRFTAIAERLGLLAYWRESGHAPDFCENEPAPVCALQASQG